MSETKKPVNLVLIGWICPICLHVMSPYVLTCTCSDNNKFNAQEIAEIDGQVCRRTRNALQKLHVYSMADFLSLTENRVRGLKNVGEGTWNEIYRLQCSLRQTISSKDAKIQ